ncbi:hypothetical protein ACHAXR_000372 [Thalassiosira sp. AJA248-18]
MNMTATKTTKQKKKKKKGFRPYNRYHIFFILERERLIVSKGGSTKWSLWTADAREPQTTVKRGYENLNLPPLPPRFAHLNVPEGWCIPGKQKKKRRHTRTHGMATFCELSRSIAASWKIIDIATLAYCTAVEKVRYIVILILPSYSPIVF